MSKYELLSMKLDWKLHQRARISTNRYGMTPAEGKEADWERLTREINQIRAEMRMVRYGA